MLNIKGSKHLDKMNSNYKCQNSKQIITKPRNFESTKGE